MAAPSLPDKNLVHTTHIITGLGRAGAEGVLLRLVQRLDPARFSSEIVSMTGFGDLAGEFEEAGASVRALSMSPGTVNPRKIAWLSRHLRRRRPDLIQTWMYQADLIGGLVGRYAAAVPVVWGLRGGIDPNESKLNTRASAVICARMSAHVPHVIVSCSHRLVEDHVGLGYDRARMLVIPNGFDTVDLAPDRQAGARLRSELHLSPEALVVGLVARFHPQKGHAVFFEAASQVASRHPSVEYVLLGAGINEQNDELMTMIRRAGIGSRTHLLGKRDDVRRLLPGFDVAVSSSGFGEGFSNAMGEAMACAVPCLGTDVGDTAYIIGDTGITVGPNDIRGLTAGLEDLVTMSPVARHSLGLAARRRIKDHFDIDRSVEAYARLYADIATKGMHPPV